MLYDLFLKDNNNIMIYLFFVLILIICILLMPIKINITKDKDKTNVDIYFIKLFNKRLDFDELIKRLFSDYSNSTSSINNLLYNLGMLVKSHNIIKDTCQMITISKITWIYKINLSSDELEMYAMVLGWNSISYLRSFLLSSFKRVKDEYYAIQSNNDKALATFALHMNFRPIYLLIATFKNIKDIPKIIKYHKKGSEKNV